MVPVPTTWQVVFVFSDARDVQFWQKDLRSLYLRVRQMADIPLSVDAVGRLLPTVWACKRYAVIRMILYFPEGFRRGAKEFVQAWKAHSLKWKWPMVTWVEFDPTVHLTDHSLLCASRRVAGCASL